MQYSFEAICIHSLTHEKRVLVLFFTTSEVTRLPFYFVCLRNITFVLVVKVISIRLFFGVFIIFALFLFYLLITLHVRQENEQAISNTILTGPPNLETHRST